MGKETQKMAADAAELSGELAAEASKRIARALAAEGEKKSPEEVAGLLVDAKALLTAAVALIDVLVVR